jgi:carbon storage regulator CsrA
MLVLARRLHERIILPTLDTTIQVVGIQGNLVRLGIEAPPAVAIFREEVYDPTRVPVAPAPPPALAGHNVRNRMANLGLSVALLHRQLPAGLSADARLALEQIETHLAALKAQVQALLDEKPALGRERQVMA